MIVGLTRVDHGFVSLLWGATGTSGDDVTGSLGLGLVFRFPSSTSFMLASENQGRDVRRAEATRDCSDLASFMQCRVVCQVYNFLRFEESASMGTAIMTAD